MEKHCAVAIKPGSDSYFIDYGSLYDVGPWKTNSGQQSGMATIQSRIANVQKESLIVG